MCLGETFSPEASQQLQAFSQPSSKMRVACFYLFFDSPLLLFFLPLQGLRLGEKSVLIQPWKL